MNHGILHTKSGPSQQEATKSAPWGDTETPLPVNIISLWKSKKNYGAFSFEYNLHLGILVRLPWNLHDLVRIQAPFSSGISQRSLPWKWPW